MRSIRKFELSVTSDTVLRNGKKVTYMQKVQRMFWESEYIISRAIGLFIANYRIVHRPIRP